MKLAKGHLRVTPKSLGTAATASLAVALAWGYLTPQKAEAVSGLVAVLAAMVVPKRGEGA